MAVRQNITCSNLTSNQVEHKGPWASCLQFFAYANMGPYGGKISNDIVSEGAQKINSQARGPWALTFCLTFCQLKPK